MLEDALLAKNKILTQQIEQLIAQMVKLSQQLYFVHSSQSQSQPIMCNFCERDHHNGHFFYQNNSSKTEDPSILERMSKVADALAKTMIVQEKSKATIRSIDIQMGQMAKQIAEGPIGQFLAKTTTNPKEHCNNVVAEKEDEIEGKIEDKEREKKRSEEEKINNKERGVLEKDLSYPRPPSKIKRRKEILFINCSLKIILQEIRSKIQSLRDFERT